MQLGALDLYYYILYILYILYTIKFLIGGMEGGGAGS